MAVEKGFAAGPETHPEGRRAFLVQVSAGAGLVVLGGCNGGPKVESPGLASSAASASAPTSAAAPPPEAPLLEATLTGTVLSLRYRYSKAVAERFPPGAPWAATLLVAIHPPSGSAACRSLANGALRTAAPVLESGLLRASAEVDLAVFFGLQAPFVRYVHASFLHSGSSVLRVALG